MRWRVHRGLHPEFDFQMRWQLHPRKNFYMHTGVHCGLHPELRDQMRWRKHRSQVFEWQLQCLSKTRHPTTRNELNMNPGCWKEFARLSSVFRTHIWYRVFLIKILHKRKWKMQEKVKMTKQKDKNLVQAQQLCSVYFCLKMIFRPWCVHASL